jgi:hypothetical protein
MANNKTSSAGKLAAGLGVAALAAGAAAAYYLTGEGGKAHRKEIQAWAKKAKAEVAQKVKGVEKLSRSTYEQAVKDVMAKYKEAKNVDPKELISFGKELQGHWTDISKQATMLMGKKPALKKVTPIAKSSKPASQAKPKKK